MRNGRKMTKSILQIRKNMKTHSKMSFLEVVLHVDFISRICDVIWCRYSYFMIGFSKFWARTHYWQNFDIFEISTLKPLVEAKYSRYVTQTLIKWCTREYIISWKLQRRSTRYLRRQHDFHSGKSMIVSDIASTRVLKNRKVALGSRIFDRIF